MSTPQLDKMEHEELADYVVAVCLGETKAELPLAQRLMGMLGVDEPIATAQITDAVEIEHLDAETIAYYLAGHASPERCKAIEDGAKLTAEEKKHVVNVATKREFESGTFGAVEYFRVRESRGSERIVNPERIEGAALAFAGGAAVNADLAADAADVQRRGRIESAALAMAV